MMDLEKKLPVGFRFSMLHRAFRRKLDAMLGEKDLTGVQFGVLGALDRLTEEGETEISQRRLEELTRISHATMTDILRRLEKKGFVRCEQSSRDRRFKCVYATERAHALREDIDRVEDATFQWLCRGLTDGQIRDLIAVTDVMLRNAWDDCEKGSEKSDD